MSYDLFFYKRKDNTITSKTITDYLSQKLGIADNRNAREWYFENPDTNVYYSFQLEKESAIEEDYDYPHYKNTGLSFNLNFMRPSFFGLEAFQLVEQLVKDLDFFIINPQASTDVPSQANRHELFENWNNANLNISADYFDKMGSSYLPEEKANKAWAYNFERKKIQTQLGENYFAPRIFFVKHKKDGHVYTLTTWTQHIPTVFPDSDYYALHQWYRKFFIFPVKKSIIISRATLMERFGKCLNDFPHEGCKIIHPEQAAKIAPLFNATKSAFDFENMMEAIEMHHIFNAKPK